MKNIDVEKILRDFHQVCIDENDSYLRTYNDFIEFFKSKTEISKHDFVVGAHLIYGWMPTIISFGFDEIEYNVQLLNRVKNGELLLEDELESLKRAVNNSIVGVSKILHFIAPENYAIWDSRIHRYVTGKKSSYGVNTVKSFMSYQSLMRELSTDNKVENLRREVIEKIGYEVSRLRAIELIMFESDKKIEVNTVVN
ncbi:hypothetical protein [Marinifilum flexuosum]|uniref:hypothetical protein n=1 Tax=Marinifilum flexuosum TaxID=1117708 RepID=UPI002494966B|nr:hypothetical protein [Marinifilum flexuosum]